MLEATERTKTRAQVLVVEIIVLDPQKAMGRCTMERLRHCWPAASVCVNTADWRFRYIKI